MQEPGPIISRRLSVPEIDRNAKRTYQPPRITLVHVDPVKEILMATGPCDLPTDIDCATCP
jgi:hypothetical protein